MDRRDVMLDRRDVMLLLSIMVLAAVLVLFCGGFTPIRRLDPGDYTPETLITNVPPGTPIVIPASQAQYYIRSAAAAKEETAIERARREAAEARAERAEARRAAFRAWLVALRDAAVLPTTKGIYQAIIDKLDEED